MALINKWVLTNKTIKYKELIIYNWTYRKVIGVVIINRNKLTTYKTDQLIIVVDYLTEVENRIIEW